MLGDWKPSSEWYTPDHIVKKVCNTFDSHLIFDPCPAKERMEEGTFYTEVDPLTMDGLKRDWGRYKYVYCNPPTPAQSWAKKALQTVAVSNTCIIFACFSEAVIWQVNELLDYPICWVRKRVNWIDGNRYSRTPNKAKTKIMLDGKIYYENEKFMKPSKAPRNYNAFVLLVPDLWVADYAVIVNRFGKNFSDLGSVQIGRSLYDPMVYKGGES